MEDDLGSSHPSVGAHDGDASLGSDSSCTPFMLSNEESVKICSSKVPLEDITITAPHLYLTVTVASVAPMLPSPLATSDIGMYLNLSFVHTFLLFLF